MAIFENNYRVSITNVGVDGSITNFGMLSLLEDIACLHSDTAGFGIKDIPNTHLSWVILHWKVQIIKRVSYGSNITVKTWSKNSNRLYAFRNFEVYDENNELICIAASKWTLINTETGSIEKITPEIIDRYNSENIPVFENEDFQKLKEPEDFYSSILYTVKRSDIDVNKHMHNLNYLTVAYEALPEEVFNSNECNYIEIMYKHSARLGDTMKCLYSFENGEHVVTLKSEDENNLHAIVKLV